nr:RNA polymerase subunit sigma-70 [Gammaproteobacteria bacterium]
MADKPKNVASLFGDVEASLSRFLLRFLDRPEDVQDVMQEAYLRVYEANASSKIRAPVAFLYKTAKNLALNERARHHNSKTSMVGDFDELSATFTERSAEFEAAVAEELSRALKALEQLSPRVRQVYILRKVHGLSQKETAEYLGISESTVEKHVAKGLSTLMRLRQDD